MKIKETNKYIVIQSVPGYSVSQIVDGEIDECEKYPKVFSKLYAFNIEETEYTTYEGQNVWRIVTQRSGIETVKCVKFNKEHINIDIFPTYELANDELQKRNKTLKIKHENSNIQNIIEQIRFFSNVKDFDNLSLSEIKLKLITINQLANNIK